MGPFVSDDRTGARPGSGKSTKTQVCDSGGRSPVGCVNRGLFGRAVEPVTIRLSRRRRLPALVRARTDADAFAEYYDLYASRVLRFFLRRVLDPELAFDLSCEVFAAAWQHRFQFRGSSAEEEQGWLFGIARNELSQYWRRGRLERTAMQRLDIPRLALEDAALERLADLSELEHRLPDLQEAMRRLPDEQRQAVELRVVDEQSYAEIAYALTVSQEVVRARVSRGLRSLARMLHEAGEALDTPASA